MTPRSSSITKGVLYIDVQNLNQPEDVASLESYGLIAWELFRYDSPKLDWSMSIETIPCLTESGRVRVEFDTAPKNDYGITTSPSWDF